VDLKISCRNTPPVRLVDRRDRVLRAKFRAAEQPEQRATAFKLSCIDPARPNSGRIVGQMTSMHPIEALWNTTPIAAVDEPFWKEPWWLLDPDVFEGRCRDYVQSVRWPDGVECPRCSSADIARIETRKRFSCRSCKYQFSVTAGTVMHNSHAPFWKWLLAIRLLVESDGGLPATQLIRQLGGSYKTAWFIEHRVRAALVAREPRSPRTETLEPVRDRVYDRSVVGCYHQHGVGYLDAYEAEREWRRRQAHNPDRFVETLRVLLEAEPLDYGALVAGAASRAGATGKGPLRAAFKIS
jgi:transposase-like protein